MKAFKIILVAVVLLLVLSLAGIAYLVAYLDRNKSLLELGAGAALGREIQIQGGVQLHWSMTPSIALAGLWIGNPEWASGPYFARAERAVVRLDVRALLHRRLEVRELTVESADINLETSTDGRRNWAFAGGSPGDVALRIDSMAIAASRLRYSAPDSPEQRVEVVRLALLGLGGEETNIDADLSYRDLAFSASGHFAPPTGSGQPGRAFEGRLTSGDASIRLSGHFTAGLALADVEAAMDSYRLALSTLWPSAPVDGSLGGIAARFSSSGDSAESLVSNLSGELKVASARLTLPAGKGREETKIAFTESSLKLTPKQPVRLRTRLAYQQQSFRFDLTGGALPDLVWGKAHRQTIEVRAQGEFDAKPLEIDGSLGPLKALFAGRDLSLDLSASHDGLKARLHGTLSRFDELSASRLASELSGPSVSRLGPWFGVALPEGPPFRLTSQVESSGRRLELKDLAASFGEDRISGEIILPLVPGERIEGRLESDFLDLTSLYAEGGQLGGDAEGILERDFAPDFLQGMDGELQFSVERMRLADAEFRKVKLDARLKAGHLKLKASAGGERLSADVDLLSDGDQWELMLHHQGKLDLAWLFEHEKSVDARSRAPLVLDVKLHGRGRSLQSILASADGHLEMVLGEGRLGEQASKYIPLGDVLFTLLNAVGSKRTGQTQSSLDCAVFQLEFTEGIATSTRGLALRTDQINVLGGGALNLSSGELDLRFKTARRRGLGISVLGIAERFIRLTGTVRKPRVELNLGGLLVQGGAAWASGGLTLLGDVLVTRLSGFSDPCEAVLKAGQ